MPGRPELTDFRRSLRYHQSQWREANGHPIGSQPIAPRDGEPSRPVGSRLPLGYARDTGATFVTPGALEAARARTSYVEAHQSFDHQRLWADLLWSPAFAFNLFGDLAADLGLADRAVHAWWPDAPGAVSEVLFVHSPGWLDAAYLGNLMNLDCAFLLDRPDGTQGIVGVATQYHDALKAAEPKPQRLPRYRQVAKRSGVFKPKAIDELGRRGPLLTMWLQHLLMHSMLQHPNGVWTWGCLVVVHPEGNTDYAEACTRYRGMLSDPSTFSSTTLEELLSGRGLPAKTVTALRERYVPAGAPGRPRS